MIGPLVFQCKFSPEDVLKETVIVLEIDAATGRVLMQREAGAVEIHNLADIKLVGDMKVTRLSMPAPGPRLT